MSFSRTLRPATPQEKRSLVDNGERLEGVDGVMVEVVTIQVKRFASGEECNDEGPILFFEVGEDELLLLWGQWLYDPHIVRSDIPDIDMLWERNAWFKHFELVRSPSSGLVVSLTSIGCETVDSIGRIGADQRLPAQPSRVYKGSLARLLKEIQ